MSSNREVSSRNGGVLDAVYRGVAVTSEYIAIVTILLMMIVMVIEVVLRYAVGQPLGWNISLIENFLMPGLVFLGLPYAYSVGAHVAAGMIYDRLPQGWRRGLDWVARFLLIICAVFLAYAGASIAMDAFLLGSAPPPLSSQVQAPTWIWRTFLPIGATMMLILVLIDIVRQRTTTRSES